MAPPSRTDQQRRSTTIRKDVLIELRGVRKQYAESSRFFQLWRASLDRTNLDMGFTNAEIAAGFYPKTFEQNYDRAIYLAKKLISSFQSWDKNKAVVLKAVRDPKNGFWFYYNLAKPKEQIKTTAHKNKIVKGMLEKDRRDLEILKMNPRRRKRLAEVLLEEEALEHGYSD